MHNFTEVQFRFLSTFKKFLLGEDSFSNRKNNWNVIRLFCAVAVIYGHSFGMFPSPGEQDISISLLTKGITYSGQIAVIVFFFLSGALVTKSYVENTTLEYLAKRIGRIFPALIVALLATVLLVQPLFSSKFSASESSRYFLKNLLNIENEFYIDGLFSDHPFTAVNGALWTIPNEIRCYLFVIIIGTLAGRNKQSGLVVLQILTVFYLLKDPASLPLIGSSNQLLGNGLFVVNSLFFTLGSLFWLLRGHLLRGELYLVVSLAIYYYWTHNPQRLFVFLTSVVLFTVFLSTSSILRRIRLKGDYSYGLYLYGWPSSQIVYELMGNIGPAWGFCMSLLIAIPAAVVSWWVVEKPFLKFVNGFAVVRT